jgi:hypothetical protein
MIGEKDPRDRVWLDPQPFVRPAANPRRLDRNFRWANVQRDVERGDKQAADEHRWTAYGSCAACPRPWAGQPEGSAS